MSAAIELELEIPDGMRGCPNCNGEGFVRLPGKQREVCEGCGGAKLVKAPSSLEAIKLAHRLAGTLVSCRTAIRARSRWLEGWRSNTPLLEQTLIDRETAAQNELVTLLREVLRPDVAAVFLADMEHRTRAIDSMPTPGHGPEASLSGLAPVRATV
jgi:hypothetical protein